MQKSKAWLLGKKPVEHWIELAKEVVKPAVQEVEKEKCVADRGRMVENFNDYGSKLAKAKKVVVSECQYGAREFRWGAFQAIKQGE